MSTLYFLLSYIPPSKKNVKFYLLKEGNEIVEVADNIQKYISPDITLVSFDLYNIISWQLENYSGRWDELKKLCNVIDLEDIAKQLCALPLKEFSKTDKNPPWSIWEQLNRLNSDNSLNINEVKNIYYGILNVFENERDEIFKRVIKYFEGIYSNLDNQLEQNDERNRYFDIEKPINEILLKTAYKGININNKKLEEYLNEIHNELYSIRNKLQLKHKIFSSNDYKHISKVLKDEGFNDIANSLYNEESYYKLLKVAQDNELTKLLYNEMKLSRSYNFLLKLGKIENTPRYPVFEAFGTVTSRILVSTPNIQQLSKKYRDIIKEEKEKVHIYVDYIQFEAGILASKSQDKDLIKGYKNDIYKDLSNKVFKTDKYRELCKILFYKYNYGAEMENMQDFLADHFKSEGKGYKIKIQSFFDKFTELKKYRQEQNEELNKNNRIGTSLGNYREKTSEEQEIEKNVTWTLSQVIQGEASLILKKAIIKVLKDEDIEFLIPMHDAALFQVPNKSKKEKEEFIINAFREVFIEHCGNEFAGAEIAKVKPFTEK